MTTITISGLPGTGKTTVAKLLEKHLGLRYVYSGEIFRQLAEKHHMSLEEFGHYCESHREIDEELDRYQLDVLKQGNVIVEGRISGWLAYQNKIPAVKILLQADIAVRAGRIVKREQGDIEKRKKEILKREKSEATRYKNYYGIDVSDTSIYDVIIDAGNKTPEEIMTIIVKHLER
ncbi:MAG: AAA family ATPase [Candidatus Thermoplasmatota archaeon]|nr:AAA family ATPase [Candidatus Thermoplasmatota archaeon]